MMAGHVQIASNASRHALICNLLMNHAKKPATLCRFLADLPGDRSVGIDPCRVGSAHRPWPGSVGGAHPTTGYGSLSAAW